MSFASALTQALNIFSVVIDQALCIFGEKSAWGKKSAWEPDSQDPAYYAGLFVTPPQQPEAEPDTNFNMQKCKELEIIGEKPFVKGMQSHSGAKINFSNFEVFDPFGDLELKTMDDQSLTRVSILRKSREVMIHVFLFGAGELYFHFSFSSRFSRFLDNKSLSFLDLQDF